MCVLVKGEQASNSFHIHPIVNRSLYERMERERERLRWSTGVLFNNRQWTACVHWWLGKGQRPRITARSCEHFVLQSGNRCSFNVCQQSQVSTTLTARLIKQSQTVVHQGPLGFLKWEHYLSLSLTHFLAWVLIVAQGHALYKASRPLWALKEAKGSNIHLKYYN